MKLLSTLNRLPLIGLLSLGLVCSPLVASADDDDRGRRGEYRQDRGQHDRHNIDHRRDKHDHGNRHSYRKGYKHGLKDSRYRDKHHRRHGRHGHHDRHYKTHHHYRYWQDHDHRHGHYNDTVEFMLGLYSGNLGIIVRD